MSSLSVRGHRAYVLSRRDSSRYMLLLFTLALLLVVGVNQVVMRMTSSPLPLDELIASVDGECTRLDSRDGKVAPSFSAGHDVSLATLPPSTYGVAVWVDDARWLEAVHDTLDAIDARVTANEANATTTKHMLYRVVRLQKNEKVDAAVAAAASALVTQRVEGEQGALVRVLSNVARQQQLGLPMLQHAFQPDLHRGMAFLSISFFTLDQDNRSDSRSGAGTATMSEQPPPVWCERFDADRYYCLLHADATTSSLVSAALASVLADALGLASFRDTSAVARWHVGRQVLACRHASHALHVLQQSLKVHTGVTASAEVLATVEEVRGEVRRRDMVRAAHAADSLEYHPLLTPQMYVPWDNALLLHATLLQPFAAIVLLGLRVVRDERRKRQKQQRAVQTETKAIITRPSPFALAAST